MSLDAYEVRGQPEELVMVLVRLLGTGAADPTLEEGPGVTATHVATGQYRLTFADHLGNFEGAFAQFAQAAPAAGGTNLISIDHDSYTAAGKALDFYVEDPGSDTVAPALADLATTDKVYLQVWFKRARA